MADNEDVQEQNLKLDEDCSNCINNLESVEEVSCPSPAESHEPALEELKRVITEKDLEINKLLSSLKIQSELSEKQIQQLKNEFEAKFDKVKLINLLTFPFG